MDVAPGPVGSLPETGLGRGWESAAIVGITAVLLLFGLLTLYGATSVMAQSGDLLHYHYLTRQGAGVAIGLAAMLLCARIPTEWWQRLAGPMMAVSAILLIVIVLPFTQDIAPVVNGARRWLRIGVTIQPSDLAKLAVVVWTAALAVRKQPQFRSLRRGLAPFLAGWAVILVPVMLEPDFSTACVILAAGLLILFVGGARIGHFCFLALLVLPFAGAMFTKGYRETRWESLFLDPGVVPRGSGFQSYQSLIAMGSGGVAGVGFGKGHQKYGFLPEAHNDYIFAMIGEEWGFVGSVAVILAFVALIFIGFRVARSAKNLFSELLAVGVVSLVALQAFVHVGVALGVLPSTGLSLPFISFGRTNMIVLLAAVGILLAVAREAPEERSSRVGGTRGAAEGRSDRAVARAV